jgi:hypothetical protein
MANPSESSLHGQAILQEPSRSQVKHGLLMLAHLPSRMRKPSLFTFLCPVPAREVEELLSSGDSNGSTNPKIPESTEIERFLKVVNSHLSTHEREAARGTLVTMRRAISKIACGLLMACARARICSSWVAELSSRLER